MIMEYFGYLVLMKVSAFLDTFQKAGIDRIGILKVHTQYRIFRKLL